MSTGSTKRRSSKRGEDLWGSQRVEVARPAAPPEEAEERVSARAWLIAGALILVAAAALRLFAPGLKPLHHDEGVNGFFLTNIVRGAGWKYDPTNYHGPTLYYLTLPVVAVTGLTTFALRFVTAAFGVGTVWLALCLRRRLGSVGSLAAAALIAVSPAAVYYSRYYIHETLFLFFTLAMVVTALRFYETRRPLYLMLLSASTALLFATKETAFITVGTLVLATLVSWAWASLTRAAAPPAPPQPARKRKGREAAYGRGEDFRPRRILAAFGPPGRAAALVVGALALFAFVWIVFYSSFFKNWQGAFWDSFRAFDVWSKTGTSEFHAKPFHTYLKWLVQEEAPVLVLATAGTAAALFERRRNRFAIFAGAWAFGILLAYSLIPYKTPWLVLNFVVPMCLAAGYALGAFDRMGPAGAKARAPVLVVGACAVLFAAYQTAVLNFSRYDDDRYPYVYSHSRRELHDLVVELERLARRSGRGQSAGISVASPEYWPLPWYLRDYKGVAYDTRILSAYDPATTAVVIGRDSDIAAENQTPRLRSLLAGRYQQVGIYDMRPGVRLVVFARSDIAGR
ncbi:MAG TPA: flippase activity-associated protein Agl23 [Pyrinomonadaceae bacterium]|nr:flippase activity-associated protein Agl23 [Pyrinomonadaceae bacterium]